MKRFVFVLGVVALLVGCGSGAAGPTPGSAATQGPAATSAPGEPGPGQATPVVPQPNAGDLESRARALIPAGATELSETTIGNAYTVQVSSSQSLEDLGAFWTQSIPAAGLQETGRFTAGDTLTIALTNPDGGIVASRDPSTGAVIVSISLGTSQ